MVAWNTLFTATSKRIESVGGDFTMIHFVLVKAIDGKYLKNVKV